MRLWLFDTLVVSALLYGVQIWGPSIDHHERHGRTDGWGGMEKPLVSMIARLIRAKASVPHNIIRAELATSPVMVEALTRSISFMHHLWELPKDKYANLALESSRQLAMQGDTTYWYGEMTSWFELHGFSMDRNCLPFNTLWMPPLLRLHSPRSLGSFART